MVPPSMIRLYKYMLKREYKVLKVFVGYSNLLVWIEIEKGTSPLRIDVPNPMPEKVDDSNFRYLHEFGT